MSGTSNVQSTRPNLRKRSGVEKKGGSGREEQPKSSDPSPAPKMAKPKAKPKFVAKDRHQVLHDDEENACEGASDAGKEGGEKGSPDDDGETSGDGSPNSEEEGGPDFSEGGGAEGDEVSAGKNGSGTQSRDPSPAREPESGAKTGSSGEDASPPPCSHCKHLHERWDVETELIKASMKDNPTKAKAQLNLWELTMKVGARKEEPDSFLQYPYPNCDGSLDIESATLPAMLLNARNVLGVGERGLISLLSAFLPAAVLEHLKPDASKDALSLNGILKSAAMVSAKMTGTMATENLKVYYFALNELLEAIQSRENCLLRLPHESQSAGNPKATSEAVLQLKTMYHPRVFHNFYNDEGDPCAGGKIQGLPLAGHWARLMPSQPVHWNHVLPPGRQKTQAPGTHFFPACMNIACGFVLNHTAPSHLLGAQIQARWGYFHAQKYQTLGLSPDVEPDYGGKRRDL